MLHVFKLSNTMRRKSHLKYCIGRFCHATRIPEETSDQSQASDDIRPQLNRNVQWMKRCRKELENLKATYPEFKQNMIRQIPSHDVQKRFAKLLDYNVLPVNGSYCLIFLKLAECLNNSLNERPFNNAQIYAMGWLIETLTKIGIMIDDVTDESKYRFGKPCWHHLEDNARILPNDLLMLYALVSMNFREQFEKTPYYNRVAALFDELTIHGATGEILDFTGKKLKKRVSLDEHYIGISRLKGSFTYKLQIKTALHMTNYAHIPFDNLLNRICDDLGRYHVLLNDYYDIQSNPYEEGKQYENIRQGDLTWFLCEAMKILSEKQYKLLEEIYGSNEETHIQKVLQLYDEANLMEKYLKHEKKVREMLIKDINSLPDTTLRNFLCLLMEGLRELKTKEYSIKHNFVWILF